MRQVGLDVLKSKTVILFIWYWDISIEEIKEVDKIKKKLVIQMGGMK